MITLLNFIDTGFIITLGLLILLCGGIMLYSYRRLNILENSIIEHGKILQNFIFNYNNQLNKDVNIIKKNFNKSLDNHDNDNGNQEGRIGISPYNNDNAYQTPQAWTYTWIGNASVVSGVDEGSDIFADAFTLYPNYPNPFNPVTNIKFSLTNDQFVNLSVYNMKGQLVANLVNERKASGNHSVHWNASGVASGVYLYQLQVEGNSITQKMVLMK